MDVHTSMGFKVDQAHDPCRVDPWSTRGASIPAPCSKSGVSRLGIVPLGRQAKICTLARSRGLPPSPPDPSLLRGTTGQNLSFGPDPSKSGPQADSSSFSELFQPEPSFRPVGRHPASPPSPYPQVGTFWAKVPIWPI